MSNVSEAVSHRPQRCFRVVVNGIPTNTSTDWLLFGLSGLSSSSSSSSSNNNNNDNSAGDLGLLMTVFASKGAARPKAAYPTKAISPEQTSATEQTCPNLRMPAPKTV